MIQAIGTSSTCHAQRDESHDSSEKLGLRADLHEKHDKLDRRDELIEKLHDKHDKHHQHDQHDQHQRTYSPLAGL